MSYDDFGVSTPFATVNGGFGVDYAEMNKGVQPIFFSEPEQDFAASEREGIPRFREVEKVRLIIAGDMFNQPVHPVDAAIKERFPEHYRRWKDSRAERHIDGTPIRSWPLLSNVQIAEFEAANILSVEMLAALADQNVNRIADGRVWRDKAKAWLEQAKDGATVTRFAAENARLTEKLEALEKQMAELAADHKRGPGRPRKDEMAA
jgi:hypothetical protein